MDTRAKYKFADWLYNRFVENYRKQDISKAFIFYDVLIQYKLFAQQLTKLSDQRRHIKQLHGNITKALKEKKADTLLLTGDEGQKEFEKTIADFEAMLRDMNCPEETIRDLVIEKRFNYGN